MNAKHVGNKLAKLRKEKGLTQKEIATQLNVSDSAISKWERGLCFPDSSLYKPLCDLFEISINELFEEDSNNKNCSKESVNNQLLHLLESKLYEMSNKEISFEEFSKALYHFSETALLLKQFNSKEEAVLYLMKESNLSKEECSKAYDIYINLFK